MIKADNITLSYDKEQMVIQNGNFQIEDNDFVFITGPSGSGKSTLLKSFYGELKPLKGTLEVNKTDMGHISTSKLLDFRKNTGIIFQDYQLVEDFTVEENIKIPLKINGRSADIIEEQVKKLLAHVKLSHKAKVYPTQLSGGEQQRVAVARALGHNPSIIFADEPTGNLDKYSADVIWGLLRDANQHLNVTVIVVTHTIPEDLDVEFRRFNIAEGVIHEVS